MAKINCIAAHFVCFCSHFRTCIFDVNGLLPWQGSKHRIVYKSYSTFSYTLFFVKKTFRILILIDRLKTIGIHFFILFVIQTTERRGDLIIVGVNSTHFILPVSLFKYYTCLSIMLRNTRNYIQYF